MLDNAPPPATRDRLPADAALHRQLGYAFARTAEAYGFEEVATPMFERADLFAARSGPDIKNSLLTFHCDHEEYALRPEMTAPVCRMVASGAFADAPWPHKLFYIAPCFRYCRPHSGRTREFTQAGIELLGDGSPAADAEVIAAGYRFLRGIGMPALALTVGTAGIFRELLPEELTADERATVLGHLDRLAGVVERSASYAEAPGPLLLEQLRNDRRELAALQARSDFRGEYAVNELPRLTRHALARRLPDEAAATFRHVWNVEGYVPEETGDLLVRTSRLRGALDDVSATASDTLAGTRARHAVAGLMDTCRHLRHYGIEDFDVSLGIARGLTFYTGTVFEISSGARKLCGGGRYDLLVELFGGEPTPATGCAVRFDTLQALIGGEAAPGSPRGVSLRPAGPSDVGTAVRLAELLRDRDVPVGASGAPVATVRGDTVHMPGGREVAADVSAVLAILSASSAPQPSRGESS